MADPVDKYEEYWKNPPAHTLTKLLIHRHYLGTWFAKLGQTMPRVLYIDGFAGRGAYGSGQTGSPLVALDVAANHIGNLGRCDIRMFFIEHRAQNARELQQRVDEKQATGAIPKHISVEVVNGSFGSEMERIVSGLEGVGAQMAPSFVMIDPFGWTDFGMDLIHRLSKLSGRSEILVTFMELYIARAVPQDQPALEEELDRLFGGREHWIGVRDEPDAASRRAFLLAKYDERLRAGGYRYVYAFEMRNAKNVPEYYLVFATKNIEGLAGMKTAMWKADPSGQFAFSDFIDNQRRTQPVLFAGVVDHDDLKARLVQKFAGQTVQVDTELREFVLVETPYLDTHYKRQVLAPMEKANEIAVVSSPRKGKSGYPNGTMIRFV